MSSGARRAQDRHNVPMSEGAPACSCEGGTEEVIGMNDLIEMGFWKPDILYPDLP